MDSEIIKAIKTLFLVPEKGYTPERIRQIREWLGETQEEFASRFHSSAVAVRKWESGDRELSGSAARVMSWVEILADRRRKRKNAALAKAMVSAKFMGVRR